MSRPAFNITVDEYAERPNFWLEKLKNGQLPCLVIGFQPMPDSEYMEKWKAWGGDGPLPHGWTMPEEPVETDE